jgi:hypothetical protein
VRPLRPLHPLRLPVVWQLRCQALGLGRAARAAWAPLPLAPSPPTWAPPHARAAPPCMHAGATGEGLDLRVAVINGLGNAKKLVKQLQEGTSKYDFIEASRSRRTARQREAGDGWPASGGPAPRVRAAQAARTLSTPSLPPSCA